MHTLRPKPESLLDSDDDASSSSEDVQTQRRLATTSNNVRRGSKYASHRHSAHVDTRAANAVPAFDRNTRSELLTSIDRLISQSLLELDNSNSNNHTY